MPDIQVRLAPASLAPTSYDAESRTIDLVWTTGATVRRFDWAREEVYDEVLTVDSGAVRLDRLNSGAPLLDSHSSYGVRNVIGSVVPGTARIAGGRGIARVRLSEDPAHAGIVANIAGGIIKNVSVGYRIHKVDRVKPDDGPRQWLVRDWEPFEISAVPIPADPGAQFRSFSPGDSSMPTAPQNPTPPSGDAARAAIEAERTRADTINTLATRAGLRDLGDQHIRAGTSVDTFRNIVVETMFERDQARDHVAQSPIGHIGGGHGFGSERTMESPTFFRDAVAEAIFCRSSPTRKPSAQAVPFMNQRFSDIARACLERSGERNARMLSDHEAIRAGLHSTSDFPLILGSAIGREVAASYEAVPSALERVAKPMGVQDFRERSILRLSQFSDLEKVNEHGEFKRGTFEESGEKIKAETFGKVFGITRQALVNDDLGAFNDVPRALGVACANFKAQALADLVTSGSGLGPVMSDGKRLFHAEHGNLAGSGALIGKDAISAARTAMRAQTDMSGQLIAVSPRYLVVGPELETEAEMALSAVNATSTAAVNIFAGRLELVVEPRISGRAWYVVSGPEIDGLAYCFLSGSPGPQIDSRVGFDVDGLEVRVRLDFGCAYLGWQSWYRNPGA